ncbi:MAG: methyltransferase domain-containing protein [Patescibacteria group bacterium]
MNVALQPKLVYVGCGHHRMDGFLHVEKNVYKNKAGLPDILADITVKIPLADNSVDLIYSRNTMEHLTYREFTNHLLECQRVLKTGGCVRMVVPNFEMWIKEYQNKIYRPDRELNPDLPNENYVDTFVANVLYHDHFYLHNFDTLSRALRKTGFTEIKECEPGETKIKVAGPEFLKAEIRKHEFLIIEAEKSGNEPQVKVFPLPYPKNILHKILAKYFNIKVVFFTRQCPIFPSKWWFKEKIAQFRQSKKSLDNLEGASIKQTQKPSYEKKLDLRI